MSGIDSYTTNIKVYEQECKQAGLEPRQIKLGVYKVQVFGKGKHNINPYTIDATNTQDLKKRFTSPCQVFNDWLKTELERIKNEIKKTRRNPKSIN